MNGAMPADIDRAPDVRSRAMSSSFEPEGVRLGDARKAKTSQAFGLATC